MSFQDDVRNTREKVLRDATYSVPLAQLEDRVKAYKLEQNLEQTQVGINEAQKEER